MVPLTYFAILALAAQVLAISDAGYYGHETHQRPHRRDVLAAYESSSPSTAVAMPYSTLNRTTSRSNELTPQSSTSISAGYTSPTSIVHAVSTACDSFSSEADAIPATSQSLAAGNGNPTSKGLSSEDITTPRIVRSTRTMTSYTTIYLSSTSASLAALESSAASSIADSNSAFIYKEVKEMPANTADSNTAVLTVAEQCGAVTVTATKIVTEYVTVSASSIAMAPIVDSSAIPSSSVFKAKSSSCWFPTNSTHPVRSAYSSAPYSVPVPSTNSSEAAALSATAFAPAYNVPSSISEAAAVPTAASSAPAYSALSSSATSEAAAVSTSTSSAIIAAIIAIDYENEGLADTVATSSTTTVASSTSAIAGKSSNVSSTSGKRGLAYNDASLTDCFTGGSEITWAYNWDSSAGDLASGLTFIPTLWGTGSNFANSWIENAKSAISSGSTTLFSFNEPDLTAQANISPVAAAAAYKTYMNPLGDSAKLCAPSVTNSGTDGQGLSWLSEFLDACTDCQIDCINIHWYDSSENTIYFKSHIEDATTIANGKPIYVSEFGASGSDEQISSFLQEIMPYMDSNSAIAGYAYFMVSRGVLVSGTEPSIYGTVYKSFSS